ncbi:MAG: helix-turn-helix transcriptional regulator [Prevotella sp.]|nr:helix-turn-helix transcriptional regulator [Candidatus Prevotella equi]
MRFKEVLKKYGLTQTELALKLGINRVSVARLINDDNDIRKTTLIKIANSIGCSVGELFDDYKETCDHSPTTLTCPKCGAKLSITINEEES